MIGGDEMWKVLGVAVMVFVGVLGLSLSMGHGEAAPLNIMVCGEAAGDGAEQKALENARYRAVKKALLQITSANNAPDSLYQQLLKQYNRFSGQPVVSEKKKTAEGCYVLGRVPVDISLLQEQMKQKIVAEKSRDADSRTVYFFVRVNGYGGPEKGVDSEVLKRYAATFQELGFTTEAGDMEKINAYDGQDYAAFSAGMHNALNDAGEVTLAVIGEINLLSGVQDAQGSTVSSRIHMEVIDCLNGQKTIAEVNDAYDLRRATLAEAQRFVLYKTALNSSKTLADQTMLYWQQHK